MSVDRKKTGRDLSELHDESTLTAEEVAAWLRVTPAWVRGHASGNRRPKLPSFKLGKYVMFRWGSLKAWRAELEGSSGFNK